MPSRVFPVEFELGAGTSGTFSPIADPCDHQGESQDFWLLIGWSIRRFRWFDSTCFGIFGRLAGFPPVGWTSRVFCAPSRWVKFPQFFPKRWISHFGPGSTPEHGLPLWRLLWRGSNLSNGPNSNGPAGLTVLTRLALILEVSGQWSEQVYNISGSNMTFGLIKKQRYGRSFNSFDQQIDRWSPDVSRTVGSQAIRGGKPIFPTPEVLRKYGRQGTGQMVWNLRENRHGLPAMVEAFHGFSRGFLPWKA